MKGESNEEGSGVSEKAEKTEEATESGRQGGFASIAVSAKFY
jgi:hypothetical protein